ncbi:MAG TPA: hypothetical protein VK178_09235 [Opitutaceae bacterium]|nr:hypothetical protein [Opitutaceae bacterium]
MKTFLKVAFLLGLMVLVLLALPAVASHFCGGLVGGLAALGLMVVAGVLLLGLAVIGGGTAAVVVLGVLLALGCVVIAVLLPIALPILLMAGLIALIVKLARRNSRPTAVAT